MAKPTVKPNQVEISLHECFLIGQKIKEWRNILENAKNDPNEIKIKRSQIDGIQKKLGKMCDTMYETHGRSEWSDELISKLYYSNLYVIGEIQNCHENWARTKKRADTLDNFMQDERMQELIKSLNSDEAYTPTEFCAYIVNNSRPSDLAIEFTSFDTGLSEDRIRKKKQKIYKN